MVSRMGSEIQSKVLSSSSWNSNSARTCSCLFTLTLYPPLKPLKAASVGWAGVKTWSDLHSEWYKCLQASPALLGVLSVCKVSVLQLRMPRTACTAQLSVRQSYWWHLVAEGQPVEVVQYLGVLAVISKVCRLVSIPVELCHPDGQLELSPQHVKPLLHLRPGQEVIT